MVMSRYAGKKRDPFYATPAWRALRIVVLQRDAYWCQVCRKRWANTVHHKISRKERPDLALDADNCEAICGICHNQAHPEKGRPQAKPQAIAGIRIINV